MKKQSNNGNSLIQKLVILGDFVMLNTLLALFFHFTPDIIPTYFTKEVRIVLIVANFSLLISEYCYAPIIHYRHLFLEYVLLNIFKMALLQSALMFVFIRVLCDGGGFFRFLLIYTPIFILALLILRYIERMLVNWYRQSGGNTRTVLFVGSDPANAMIYRELTSSASTGYKIEGYYGDGDMKDCPEKLKHLGTIEDFNQLLSKHDDSSCATVHDIFCSLTQDTPEEIIRIMRYCDKHTIHFYYVPRMIGNIMLNLKPVGFGEYQLFTNHKEPLLLLSNRLTKRIFDIIVSLFVCLCMLPFIPIIALIVKIQSPGPVFFKQARTGLNGRTFLCYKFRSMHINSAADLQQATLDDPRKFPFGQFMRKCNIDEFPQFFNVLRGDMSIVGPRPHMVHHTEVYSALIEKYMVRHFSKPGITGYAQVSGFRGETKELWQMEERIRRDIWYIENWTFWLDIRIIFMTAGSLFRPDQKAY